VIALAFAAAGAGIGLAEPTRSAVVSQLLPDHLRGSGFGVLGAVQAVGDLVTTVVAGVLYTAFPVGGVCVCGHLDDCCRVVSGLLRPSRG
jgi:MFS family permease